MKLTLLIAILLSSLAVLAQPKYKVTFPDDDTMSKILDYKPILVKQWLKGLIEIDGHLIKNDSKEYDIYWEATLDGITIRNTIDNSIWEYRHCGIKGCKIIHLIPKNEEIKQQIQSIWPRCYTSPL